MAFSAYTKRAIWLKWSHRQHLHYSPTFLDRHTWLPRGRSRHGEPPDVRVEGELTIYRC